MFLTKGSFQKDLTKDVSLHTGKEDGSVMAGRHSLYGRVQGCLFIKNLFLLPFIKKESGFFHRIILLPHPRQEHRIRIDAQDAY